MTVINPAWQELNLQVRQKHTELKNIQKLQQNVGLTQPLSEAAMHTYEQHQGNLQEDLDHSSRH